MPRYLVEFTDGTSVEYGAPGLDNEKIRATVKNKLENSHNKEVASLKKVKVKNKEKKEKKTKPNNSKKSSIGLTQQGSKGKNKGKVSKNKNNSVDNISVSSKLNLIETSLENLFDELQELKASMILSRRRQLIGELELLESQII